MQYRLLYIAAVLSIVVFLNPASSFSQDKIRVPEGKTTEDRIKMQGNQKNIISGERERTSREPQYKGQDIPFFTAGDILITDTEFLLEVEKLPKKTSSMKAELLDSMVLDEILYKEAMKQGFVKKEEGEKKNDETGPVSISYEKQKAVADAFRKEVLEKEATVTDDEVRSYYEANKNSFIPPVTYKIFTLSLQKFDRSYQSIPDKAKKEAEAIRERLLKGEKPDDIWSSYSNHEILVQKTPKFTLSEETKNFPKEIIESLPSMKVGSVSPVFDFKNMFNVSIVTEVKQPEKTMTLEEAKDSIHKALVENKIKAKEQKYARDFFKENKPVIHNKNLLK
jgi:hypothetical protein